MEKKDNNGFSLVEIVIVIAIMAVLVAVLVPRYLKYVEKSRAVVCQNSMDQMAQAYLIDSIEAENTGTALMDTVAAELGLEKDTERENSYTGVCPSGGVVSVTYSQTGKPTIVCSKHSQNAAPSFVPSLITILKEQQNTIKNGNKTLKKYFSEGTAAAPKSIDSNAAIENVESWANSLTAVFGELSTDQTWRIVSDGTNIRVYITTAGAVGTADVGSSVDVIEYIYDKDFNLQGTPTNKTLGVVLSTHGTNKTKYAALNTK